MVDYSTALQKSLAYFNGDTLAADVVVGKYALTTPDGDILEPTPTEMHQRTSSEFARIEAKYPDPISQERIFALFDRFKYVVPQGSPLAGIGNPYQTVSLSNCFVVESPYDSYGGILKADQELVQLMKRRGGVGTDVSSIRPKGLKTSNAAKTTDGIGVFMERFSNTCREVAQGGRRGALMLSISVHHPEIETFISIKSDRKKVTGANLSIRLTDEFMKAVESDSEFELRFPVDSKEPTIRKMIKARELWDKIVAAAHDNAEPGLLFWDNIKNNSPADLYENFQTISTNPCGEIPLSAYDSCRLMILNTLSFVDHPFTEFADFDFMKFANQAHIAQRLMDDLIDLELECIEKIQAKIENDPEPEDVKRVEKELWIKIKSACVNGRRTGLGLTAIGDTLAALNIRYGSPESIVVVEKIYKTLALSSYASSIELASERGAFPDFSWEKEKNHPFLMQIFNELSPKHQAMWKKTGRRNIANLTTAPVGSISILTQTTSGCEPVFEVSYGRRRKINPSDKEAQVDFVDAMGDKWQYYTVYHPQFKKWMEISGKTQVEDSPYWKSRANDVDWVAKIDLQAAAQKWICHSISNTTNVPKDTTVETVKEIYMRGWKSGCKGVTIYRDGCRDGVLITKDSAKKTEFDIHHAPKRPEELVCDVMQTTVKGEKWIFFIGLLDGQPYEIMGGLSKFITIPKRVKKGKIMKHVRPGNSGRYDFHYDYEEGADNETVVKDINTLFENAINAAFTRTISLALRHGTPVQYVVEQLLKGSEKDDDLFSFSRAVSRVLKGYIKDGAVSTGKTCTNCNSPNLIYQEGCLSCKDCGNSKCG
jgi:ribonucleoside-diphosphate reductase alpha chain